ncbi:MAG: efflux RND transporter periplasmic adaptor subunit [Alphaproteobacteria bacterium]|nr:efflux RND transporter periplasmic adaptor subunit [Alphaproteobacteria bacterium]
MLLLALLACSGTEAPAASGGPPRAASVEVAPAREGQLSDTWSVLGELRALERAELAAGASGAVEKVTAREGDAVAQGALLVEVDAALAAAELAAAEADEKRLKAELDQAKSTLSRVGRVESGVLAANEVELTRTRVASLEAEAEGARARARLAGARLGRHRVRAPFPGIVAKRHVDPGDWVDPGKPVLDLVRVDTVEVRVDAPLDLAKRVAVGDSVKLGSAAGRIVGVVPALDPVSRTAVIRIEPDGPLAGLVPGSPVEVAFDVEMSGGVVVPRDAVVPGPTDSRVFKVEDGAAHAIPVQTLATTADEVLVQADGLAPGDLLVVRGNERLRPDQPVTVLP